MDRFALSFSLGYPTAAEELQMLQQVQGGIKVADLQPCISLKEVQELQQLNKSLQQYIVNLVRATRSDEEITLGVSPRGVVILQRATQVLALIDDRDYATPDDVKFLAPYVLSHRTIPAGGRRAGAIVARLLWEVSIP